MDWYSIGVAAVCGGIAGAIGGLAATVFKKKQVKQIISPVVTVVLFVALFAWGNRGARCVLLRTY